MSTARPVLLLTILLASCTLASCATRTHFRPREGATAESPDGRPAAQYTLAAESGTTLGTLRVWSTGADYDTESEGDPVVVSLGFEIENVSEQRLVLDREALVLQDIDPAPAGAQGPPVQPLRPMQPFEVPPGSMLRTDAAFDLGVELTPYDLEAFSVRWTVRAENGTRFQEITPFRRDRYAYYYPYDPYWHGYMGWGFTWCW